MKVRIEADIETEDVSPEDVVFALEEELGNFEFYPRTGTAAMCSATVSVVDDE